MPEWTGSLYGVHEAARPASIILEEANEIPRFFFLGYVLRFSKNNGIRNLFFPKNAVEKRMVEKVSDGIRHDSCPVGT